MVRMQQHLRENIAELITARQAAEKANIAKSDFLAIVGHELRTPMNGVLGMAEVLLMEDLPKHQRGHAEEILNSGRRRVKLVNSMLEYVAAADARLPNHDLSFDLSDRLANVQLRDARLAEKKRIAFEFGISGEQPALLTSDYDHIRKVVAIFVDNAIAFTEKGKGGIITTIENDQVQFKVQDTGIGMSPDVTKNLFKPFFQADSRASRQHEGLGLGLALAQRIVESMGGTISLTSTPSVGSLFVVTLPLRPRIVMELDHRGKTPDLKACSQE